MDPIFCQYQMALQATDNGVLTIMQMKNLCFRPPNASTAQHRIQSYKACLVLYKQCDSSACVQLENLFSPTHTVKATARSGHTLSQC